MKKTLLMFLVLSLTLIGGCAAEETKGELSVKLTDAPITDATGKVITAVNITVTRVDVVKKDSSSEESESVDKGDGVTTVFEGEKSFNLLDYQNGETLDFGTIEIEEGDYTQLRFVAAPDSATIVFDGDAAEYALSIPSGSSSGIKIKAKGNKPLFTVAGGEEKTVIFDLDAQASISVSESKDGYRMVPVIKMVSVNGDEVEIDESADAEGSEE